MNENVLKENDKVPSRDNQDFAASGIAELLAFPCKWLLAPGIFWARDQYFPIESNSIPQMLCLVTRHSVVHMELSPMGLSHSLDHQLHRGAVVPHTV